MSNPGAFGLAERGQAIYDELSDGTATRDSLALEAARLADRLDELDRIIQGKGVLNLMQFRLDFPEADDEPFVVEVKFQHVLEDARKQALAYSQIVQKLGITDKKQSAPTSTPVEGVINLASMRQRAQNVKGA